MNEYVFIITGFKTLASKEMSTEKRKISANSLQSAWRKVILYNKYALLLIVKATEMK